MKKRRVLWDSNARADLVTIADYIAQQNPGAVDRIIDKLEEAGLMLQQFAFGHAGRVEGTFERPVVDLPYILSYALESPSSGEEQVVILRIIHTARDWPDQSWPK
jgi:plasmid stabilization system protein ParE